MTDTFDKFFKLIRLMEREVMWHFLCFARSCEDLARLHDVANGALRLTATERYYCVCCERHLREFLARDLNEAAALFGLDGRTLQLSLDETADLPACALGPLLATQRVVLEARRQRRRDRKP
jgi:hypothetical protein